MFARLRGNAGHEVCGDERPQHDGVLTGRDVRDEVSVKVDGNQYDWHLTHLQYTTYTAVHTPTVFRPHHNTEPSKSSSSGELLLIQR